MKGHGEIQNIEYFRYVSRSEDPISIHVLPLDSSNLDVYVVFGEENVFILNKKHIISLKNILPFS